jgi:hypothetical protein
MFCSDVRYQEEPVEAKRGHEERVTEYVLVCSYFLVTRSYTINSESYFKGAQLVMRW